MRRTLLVLFAISIASFVLTTAAAGSGTTLPIKWSQPPVEIGTHLGMPLYNGWDEPSMRPGPPIAADDWQCRDELPVTDFHWWGSYPGWSETAPLVVLNGFWFGIYTDVPADENNLYSHPGTLIWSHQTTAYQEVFVGYDQDPWTGNIDSAFQYNVDLPTTNWFHQDSDVHTIYWLSIAAVLPSGTTINWGWKSRPHNYQDDAVTQTAAAGWEPIGDGWDLAFELSTVPEPSSLIALAVGLTSMGGVLIRRKRGA